MTKIQPLYISNDLIARAGSDDIVDVKIEWINILKDESKLADIADVNTPFQNSIFVYDGNEYKPLLFPFINPPIICNSDTSFYPTIKKPSGPIILDKLALLQNDVQLLSAQTYSLTDDIVFNATDAGDLLSSNWYSLFLVDNSGTLSPVLTTLVRVNNSTIDSTNNLTTVVLGSHLNPNQQISPSDINWTEDIFNTTNGEALVLSGNQKGITAKIIHNSTTDDSQSTITLTGSITLNRGDWICISPMGYDKYKLVGSAFRKSSDFMSFLHFNNFVVVLESLTLWVGSTNTYKAIDLNQISPLANFILDVNCVSYFDIWSISFSYDGSTQFRYLSNYRNECAEISILPMTNNKQIYVNTDNTYVIMNAGGYAY